MRTTRFPWLMLNSTKRRTASRRWSRSLGGGCCAKNSSAENTVGSAIASAVVGESKELVVGRRDVGFSPHAVFGFAVLAVESGKSNRILLATLGLL